MGEPPPPLETPLQSPSLPLSETLSSFSLSHLTTTAPPSHATTTSRSAAAWGGGCGREKSRYATFERLPPELIERIARWLIRSTTTTGPPAGVVTLLLISKRFDYVLNLKRNKGFYADLFKERFDSGPVERRWSIVSPSRTHARTLRPLTHIENEETDENDRREEGKSRNAEDSARIETLGRDPLEPGVFVRSPVSVFAATFIILPRRLQRRRSVTTRSSSRLVDFTDVRFRERVVSASASSIGAGIVRTELAVGPVDEPGLRERAREAVSGLDQDEDRRDPRRVQADEFETGEPALDELYADAREDEVERTRRVDPEPVDVLFDVARKRRVLPLSRPCPAMQV